MKAKLYILLILVLFAGRAVEVQARDFPAGSLIIPTDQFYQGEQDGGTPETYGLVFNLLSHQDQAEWANCASETDATALATCRALATHDIPVHWIINQDKIKIDDPDLIIQDDTLTNTAVVDLFNHTAGGSPTALTFDASSPNNDSATKITYRGGIWIIDINDLTRHSTDDSLDDLKAVEAIIRDASWSQVKVHVAKMPFSAPVFRTMQGKPPRIALMNSEEDPTKGNAKILEAYLRLAGICPEVYDVVSPNQIGGVVDVGNDNNAAKHTTSALVDGDGKLLYDFVWAPHWTGENDYAGDINMDLTPDVDEIVLKIQEYLKSGGALLAECAAIETFEYNVNGLFLSDHGFAHNGGSNDPALVVYNDVTSPYAQIGEYDFGPGGGHLHNWRPFQLGDDGESVDDKDKKSTTFNFDTPPSENSSYRSGVTRYTVDDKDQDGVGDLDWDYYVGGYAYGNKENGYVVYLGGHKYAECKDSKGLADPNVHNMKFEFTKSISDEVINLEVKYDGGTLILTGIDPSEDFGSRKEGSELEIDFTGATLNDKKLEGIGFRNLTGADMAIEQIELQWSGGHDDQKIKKIEDKYTDTKHLDAETEQKLTLDIEEDFTIAKSPSAGSGSGCAQNDDCDWTNLAGVRYVLNTLFNIKYQRGHSIFSRATPIVSHPYLYQGYYAYELHPEAWVDDELVGHFRRFDMTQAVGPSGIPDWDWDTAVDTDTATLIPLANTNNSDGRLIFTGKNDGSGNFSKLAFDFTKIEDLRVPLALTPAETGTDKDDDEKHLINQVRGKRWNHTADTPYYVNDPNRLGAIMHSAPVIVSSSAKDSRFSSRTEVAYVGDLDGMLHAIDTGTGAEKWAYIPSNLLDKLKNDRSDPYVYQDFPAVDASPTARNIYYDFDFDPATDPPQSENRSWHTILVCAQGFGGKSIFALDVTDPNAWEVLWETTVVDPDTSTPGGGMGHSFRAALDRIKVEVPVLDIDGNQIAGLYEYRVEWRVFVATNFDAAVGSPGGINVFSFDLRTGAKKWAFSAAYTDNVDDIPGAVTSYDLDDDTFADRIFVGDMDGRLWELDANDPVDVNDSNRCIYKTSDSPPIPIPLFSAGVNYPISVSPAITRHNGHVILVFGTGGAHFADLDRAYSVYYVDVTAAGRLSQSDIDANYADPDYNGAAATFLHEHTLPAGQKIWSSPTIAAGQIWIASAAGTMESSNPSNDLLGEGQLQILDLDFNSLLANSVPKTIKKVRGSLYASNQHVYATAIDGSIIQFGDGDFPAGDGNRVFLKSWHDQ